MDESRTNGRMRAMLGAQIAFNNRNSTIDCIVRDISSTGARLSLSDTVALPEEFELFVPQRGKTYKARLRWRTREGAGVELLREGANAPPARAPIVESGRRLAELESENAALHLKVLELTQRLEEQRRANERAA